MSKLNSEKGAALWKERFSLARTNQERMFKRFSNWYDALYAQVGKVPSPWRSKIYVPILARQTWALVSKFLQLKPGFEVRVRSSQFGDDDIQEKAEKAQKKLEYDYDNPRLDESIRDKLFSPLLDACVTGTGFAKVVWTTEMQKRYERLIDPITGMPDMSQEQVFEKVVGYNDLIPVNVFNVFVSPAATDLYTAPWIIIQENIPLAELESRNVAGSVELYKNLDKVSGKAKSDERSNYNRSRNRLLGNDDMIDKTIKMVAVYECYEGDKICTYAEGDSTDGGWVLIREQKNPYWHGKYPLVKFHVKKKPFQFWGEGLYETTYRLQAAYNDVFNHYLDAWNVSNDPMLIVPENANVNDYVIEPAGLITYRGDTPPAPFKHAEPNPQQLQTIVNLFDAAIEGVTVSQYATGNPNSATDKTKGTATGILKLQEAAGDVIGFMRSNFKQSILQIGSMWLSNNQQFMSEPTTVTMMDKDGMNEMEITPQDMQGDMELVIDEASMQPTSKEEMAQQYMAFTQQLLQLQQASTAQAQMLGGQPMALKFPDLAEELAEKMGLKNFNSVLLTDEELAQMNQESMMQALGAMQTQEQMQAQQMAEQEQMAADEEVAKMADELVAAGELDPRVMTGGV